MDNPGTGAPYHVMHWGERRQPTFFRYADYVTYLHFAAEEFTAARVKVWACCLMPNHIHLIARPSSPKTSRGRRGSRHPSALPR